MIFHENVICNLHVYYGRPCSRSNRLLYRQTFTVNGQTYRIINKDYIWLIYNSKNTRDVFAPVLDSQENPMNSIVKNRRHGD